MAKDLKVSMQSIIGSYNFQIVITLIAVYLYMLIEDGFLKMLPYLVWPVFWGLFKRQISKRNKVLLCGVSVVIFGVLLLVSSPALRLDTGLFAPLKQVSSATESPKDLAAAAEADPLNPSLQLAAAQANPSDSAAIQRALREQPGNPQAWEVSSASSVPDQAAGWEGFYLEDNYLVSNLAAQYATKAGGLNHQIGKGTTGYYSVAAYLWALDYAIKPDDQAAAKAAECYGLAGDLKTAAVYTSHIKDQAFRSRVDTWIGQLTPDTQQGK